MDLVGKNVLEDCYRRHPDARSYMEVLVLEIEDAAWKTPHDLKGKYPKASLIGKNVVYLDVMGNRFRMAIKVDYRNQCVIVQKAGSHKEYDTWSL